MLHNLKKNFAWLILALENENINIASLICERNAKGEDASMCICIDGKLNNAMIEKIKQIPDIYFVRNVSKLEN